jgi:hypothetical protein
MSSLVYQMNVTTSISNLATLPSYGMPSIEPQKHEKYRLCSIFHESPIGHKQPCQPVYAKLDIHAATFINKV